MLELSISVDFDFSSPIVHNSGLHETTIELFLLLFIFRLGDVEALIHCIKFVNISILLPT